MKKFFTLLFAVLLSFSGADSANAANYNFSWHKSPVCAPGSACLDLNQLCAYRGLGDCNAAIKIASWGGTPCPTVASAQVRTWKAYGQCYRWAWTLFTATPVSNPSEYCYKYSCYYTGISYAKNANIPVQPLTEDAGLIKNIIRGTNPVTNGSTSAGITAASLSTRIGAYGHANLTEAGQLEAGGGTSSMQGLLWSWRVLSPKWEGKWNQRSAYEQLTTASNKRATMPQDSNSKHIILISDGADNDGPAYKDPRLTVASDGIGQVVPATNSGAPYQLYSTCDAHKPLESITVDQYRKVCAKLEEQGVKVHIILYDYAGNDRLDACHQANPGGSMHVNVAPDKLSAELGDIFSTMASAKIRLIK